jgi:hypothetical protein
VYRLRYKAEDFPKFDVVGITTLFTLLSETVNTINLQRNFASTTAEDFREVLRQLFCQEIKKKLELTQRVAKYTRF